MNPVELIVAALRRLGLSDGAIAGFLGNAKIESSDNPSALNSGEGAIGLFQWEGGRRQGLQQYAAAHGMSETDPQAQVGYLVQELQGPYARVLHELQGVNDPSQAAAIIDQSYEISSGSSRSQREAAAQGYLSSGLQSTGGSVDYEGKNVPAGTASGMPNPTASDYQNALGQWGDLLQAVPELKGLLQQAVSGGWAITKFAQAVQQTGWWRTHSDAAKSLIALQTTNPAEYQQQVANAQAHVSEMAKQFGVGLTSQQLSALALRSITESWTDQTIQHELGGLYNRGGQPTGQAAQYYQQLNQLYSQYGQPYNFATNQYRVQQLIGGATTLDTYKQDAILKAKAMFPGLIKQLDAGLTVADAAQPYQQTMAQTLELNPQSISLSDPLIKRALQGSVDSIDAKGDRNYLPTSVTQFEQQLRSDPRWQYTNNAKDTMSTALLNIGADFGFGPDSKG